MAQHVATCCPPRDPQVIHLGHEADCPLCNPQTAASGEGPADASRPVDPGAVESGTPALTPGVLEDGGSVPVGESSPPAPDAPMADPPSPPPRAVAGMTAAEANRMLDDWWRAHLAQHHPQTDDGAVRTVLEDPASSSPTGRVPVGITPEGVVIDKRVPPLTMAMALQVERCRALLERWRKDRLDYPKETPHGYAAYVAVKACEDELREALGDES